MKRTLIFIGIPILVSIAVAIKYVYGSLKVESVYVVKKGLQGLDKIVQVTRDDKGALFIKGETDKDVYFALGFAHAQDRMWQLELQRRIAKGTLSEIFGRESLNRDIWMRTLGLAEAAKSAWTAISPQTKSALTAYTNGINAWLESNPALSPEFMLLENKPEPWTELDSLSWMKVFSLNLAANMWNELANMAAGQSLTQEQAADILKTYPETGPVTIPNTTANQLPQPDKNKRLEKAQHIVAQLFKIKQSMEKELAIGGKYVGSNAWVVSGKLTDNGQPILANDPHMGIQIPALFYFASLKGDKLDVSGMTLVGLPVVIFGRNKDITWGGTNMFADTQDLYFEQTNGENAAEYRVGDQWEKFDTHKEIIHVKAPFPQFLRPKLKPVEIQVRKTHNGPVVSDASGMFDQPISLKWTALEDNDTTLEGFYRLGYATDWNSFKAAMKYHVAPALNMLYADTNNNIGFLGIGKIPVRSLGEGQFPTVAWNGLNKWTGYIPFDQWPYSYNPDQGYLVSANNKNVNSDYPYFISHDWAPSTRAERIEQLLTAPDAVLNIEYMKKIQADTFDISATKLHKTLSAYKPQDERQTEAINLIKVWNLDMAIDQSAASIFYVWTRHLRTHLFSDELTSSWNQKSQVIIFDNFIAEVSYDQINKVLTDTTPNWCDDVNTDITESCETVLSNSLNDALNELDRFGGSDMDDWQWGGLHIAVYRHTPFSGQNLLDKMFERRIANGGSPNTVNSASAYYNKTEGYEQGSGATFRQIVQMNKKKTRHLYMNSTGQSGHFLSPYYDNMIEPFQNVHYFEAGELKPGTTTDTYKLKPE